MHYKYMENINSMYDIILNFAEFFDTYNIRRCFLPLGTGGRDVLKVESGVRKTAFVWSCPYKGGSAVRGSLGCVLFVYGLE